MVIKGALGLIVLGIFALVVWGFAVLINRTKPPKPPKE